MSDEKPAGQSVTSRVLRILEAFESAPSSLSLTEIAQSADLPLPTAYRLVRELTQWGALQKNAGGRYQVGLRLWEVAQHGGRQLRDAARPYLQDLFSLTQETSHLAVRKGREALYVDRVYSSKRVPRASRVGGRLPLHATAVGKVLLAYEERWMWDAYVTAPLEAPTVRTHVQPARLLEELERIREQGYATTFEEVRPGACSIAVPVLDRAGVAVAALGLSVLSTQAAQMTRHLPVLRGVATRIGASIDRWAPVDLSARLPAATDTPGSHFR
ncbi:IclR family transcriptional regulator [Blastococcus sp. PRF04-17]|uniref:IclR family transcriptional regulator n=1 Tax=Blastococcus sp. PRF04-17 TaxID=2933797 RepID=UPI001FF32EB7|nr:IclR family transcriptional regulator [Blastococcus sp. PRF04-17]UOY02349.1 IclR family transcriptional regulator [Blastococcus sp. PRF04-17]